MNHSDTKIESLIAAGIDHLSIVISRDEIEKEDFSGPLKVLNQLTANITNIKYFREKVDVSFDGYNNTRDELWEIPDVRNYIIQLDSKFPFWLYFLSRNGGGLYVIIKCFLLPFLTPAADKKVNGEKLQNYLEERGFLAMNHLCDVAGVSEEENVKMTNRFLNYFFKNQVFQ